MDSHSNFEYPPGLWSVYSFVCQPGNVEEGAFCTLLGNSQSNKIRIKVIDDHTQQHQHHQPLSAGAMAIIPSPVRIVKVVPGSLQILYGCTRCRFGVSTDNELNKEEKLLMHICIRNIILFRKCLTLSL